LRLLPAPARGASAKRALALEYGIPTVSLRDTCSGGCAAPIKGALWRPCGALCGAHVGGCAAPISHGAARAKAFARERDGAGVMKPRASRRFSARRIVRRSIRSISARPRLEGQAAPRASLKCSASATATANSASVGRGSAAATARSHANLAAIDIGNPFRSPLASRAANCYFRCAATIFSISRRASDMGRGSLLREA